MARQSSRSTLSGQDQPDSEKCRQRPERITGVSGDEPWQGVGVAAGADTQETYHGNQNGTRTRGLRWDPGIGLQFSSLSRLS